MYTWRRIAIQTRTAYTGMQWTNVGPTWNDTPKLKSEDQAIIPNQAALDLICDGLRDLANGFESGGDTFGPLKKIWLSAISCG